MVASAVSDLLADRELASLMGKLGRDRVEREHTWAQVAGRLAAWLRKAARGSAT
jgi:glycosyltransferase involved in cell wall biosynthesis